MRRKLGLPPGPGKHPRFVAGPLPSNLRIVGLDAETAIDAAWGRSGHRDLGDAIHIATARRAGATCLVTNDSRVRGRAGVEVVSLADIVPEDSGQEGEATPLRRPQDAEVPSVERE